MSVGAKNLPKGISKMIQPGNIVAKINSVVLEPSPFKDSPDDPQAYNIVFNIEGPDLGPTFDGFFIDKNDPSKGKYKGAIGRVRADKWPFKNGTTKTGIVIKRDDAIPKYFRNVCRELNITSWWSETETETIEQYVEKFNNDGLYKDKWLKMCVAGKEYINKGGYTNFELSFPKFSSKASPFELESTPAEKSKLITFDSVVHMDKKKVETLDNGFGEEPEVTTKKKTNGDFEL